MRSICLVTEGKRDYRDLLLLADPSERMVERYLERGELYVLFEDGEPLCEAVVTRVSPTCCELKNLATAEKAQRTGCARAMLEYLFARYGAECDAMLVGTSEAGLAFYRRFGFVYSRTERGFFLQYPEPVYENGERCVDLYILLRPLRAGEPGAGAKNFGAGC